METHDLRPVEHRLFGLDRRLLGPTLGIVVGWTRRQERPWMAELLAPGLSAGLITDAELTALVGSPKSELVRIRALYDTALSG